ncbi:MAG: aminotransferase class IV [Chitinophagaceae bacterium]|nr:aminotransferase class IV [Chitinophagaceae bacterium]MCB9047520.1 aminotransferase class IV [Chitinophagales bacterium]
MRHININGKLHKDTSASVPFDSRAVRFGFGLFETMLVLDGQIQLKEYHWERLFAGIKQLMLVMPELMTRQWMEDEIMRTVKKNQMEKLCRVRFQIYAGRGGLFDGQNPWTEFVIDCQNFDPRLTQLNEQGLSLVYAEGVSKSPDSIANLKTTNAMIYCMAARQATAKKADNAIILNTYGRPIETTLANIFCIKGDTLYTPPLSEGPVGGVMRKYIMQQLPKKGFTIIEEPFTKEFLESADAVFVTNAIRRFKWVASIEDKQYSFDKILDIYESISY